MTLRHGLHIGVSDDEYRRDVGADSRPALTSTLARELVCTCAARVRAMLDGHVTRATPAMVEGQVIDALVLGGPGSVERFVVVDADDWRTKAAREQRDEALAAGRIPVLASAMAEYARQASAVRTQLAARGIDLAGGDPQVTVVWTDGGVRCRGRLDWLRVDDGGGAHVVELKRLSALHAHALARAVVERGYDIQMAAYTRGLEAVLPAVAGRVTWTWVTVELEPVVGVRLVRPTGAMRELGRVRWERAVSMWRECWERDEWPGWSDIDLDPPAWELAAAAAHGMEVAL